MVARLKRNIIMMKTLWPVFTCLLLFCIANSMSIPRSHNNRVTVKPLSDEIHYGAESEEHNSEYDHEAFLGEEEAKHFDEMTPEESKLQLSLLFDKIDLNGDGQLTESELESWIRKVQNKYAYDDAQKRWADIRRGDEDKMKWEEHEFQSYGTQESIESNPDEGLRDMIRKDKARWVVADTDGDGLLNLDEYTVFLHPEISKSMEDIVTEEALEEIDQNEDGFVDLQEFINDMVGDIEEDDDEDAEWVESEKQNFVDNLDEDRDGKLNKEELKKWLMNDEQDQVVDETQHLFREVDANMDAVLSREEVVDKYDVFVGSQATDYGDILGRHDEF